MPVLMPKKYFKTGPNYAANGEVAGYVYFPWNDQYYLDPKAVKAYNEETGLTPKKPGLASQLGPVVGAAGATALGYGLITNPSETIGTIAGLPGKLVDGVTSVGDKVAAGGEKLLASINGTTPISATPAATAVTPGAVTPQGGQTLMSQGVGDGITNITAGSEIPAGYQAVATNADGTVAIAPTAGVTAGQIIQGAGGALQTYQGITQLGRGNYLGGGINTAAGLGNVAQAAGYAPVGSTAASVVPGLNILAGGYNAVQTANMLGDSPAGGQRNSSGAIGGAGSGAGIGAGVGALVGGPAGALAGAGIGAVVGGIAGLAGSYFGSSKGERQMIRDSGRKFLQSSGILDKDYMGTLADGSKFDFGKDGKGLRKLDFKDATTGRVIGLGNVLSAAEGNYGTAGEAMTELYSGAALSNAKGDFDKARSNILHMAQQRGINKDNALAQLAKLKEAGSIDEAQYNSYVGGVNELFAPVLPKQKARKK